MLHAISLAFLTGTLASQDAGSAAVPCFERVTSSVADLAGYPDVWRLVSTSSADVTSEQERAAGETAFYEISWWRALRPETAGAPIIQCRSIFRDNGGSLRMTGSVCYRPTREPESCL